MKRQVPLFLSSLTLAFSFAAHGQGTFQNLDFESAAPAAIPGDPYRRVTFESAFPGWVGYAGGVRQAASLSNSWFLDSSGIAIIDKAWPYQSSFGGASVISGNYTVLLQAGFSLSSQITEADVTLSQESLIPVSAMSLSFRAYSWRGYDSLRVSLGGQNLEFVPLQTLTNHVIFGADIQPWQGQMARLDFTVISTKLLTGPNNDIFLDAIQFSVQPIPEPATFGLIALGAVALGGGMLRRNRT